MTTASETPTDTVSGADEISAPQPALSAGDIRVDTVRRVRAIILPFLDTAEKWRYDRVAWAFAIMLGEIPADTPEPVQPIPSLPVLLGHFHTRLPRDSEEAGN